MTLHHLPTARSHPDGEIRRTVLPGGLRVVSEAVPGSRSFSVGFFVAAGSRHEAAHLHGVSHFLEHVLFKGTSTRSAEQISARVEQVGGDLNAYTSKDHTCFHAQVLAEDQLMIIDVLADMLTGSLVRAADVEAEREVILDEIGMHNDDPDELAHELVSERLFAGSSLERNVIGDVESIRSLDRGQIAGFWRRRYRAPAIVVAAAGQVDHDRLLEELRPFADLAAGPSGRRTPRARVRAAEPAIIVRHRPLEHAQAVLGFNSPGLTRSTGEIDESRYALNLLALILGGGMASRLFQEVRERRGLAYSIDSSESAYLDAGSFTIDWGSAPERVPEIAGVIRDCVADLLDNGVTEAELERAKGQMRGQMILGHEGSGSRMSRLGSGDLVDDHRTVGEALASYDAVTADEVTAAGRAVLSAHPVTAVVGAEVNRGRLTRILDRWS